LVCIIGFPEIYSVLTLHFQKMNEMSHASKPFKYESSDGET
jgi:hypothetical protein